MFLPVKTKPVSRRRLSVAFAAVSGLPWMVYAGQFALAHKPAAPMNVIVDTDAGADDLMAIAFLLSRPDVHVEAVTVANGVAHVSAGGRNVLRLLALAQHGNVPVYLGRETPIEGNAAFPAEWRKTADDLPGVTLPRATRKPERENAAAFLARRLSDRAHPVRILALGSLTNLAEALDHVPQGARSDVEVVIMGGAFHVPGNLGDGGAFHTENKTAEWNIFVDPLAAQKVLSLGAGSSGGPGVGISGIQLRLIPLDATNQVPIDSAFLKRLSDGARAPLAKSVAQILGTNQELIRRGVYSAWDPLAAAALVEPDVVQTRCVAVEVHQSGPDTGRTEEIPGKPPNACVAFGADREGFYRTFLIALEFGVRQTPPGR